ncbi:MAG: prepilin-type N-terminal cleavage/methylation domain-containing protein [Planctomycetota bacterium]|nr:MAG: prepilin-type N-terminal cleavage/methylation domain-containing protein [Planctomycetota bacterium]
MSLKGNKGFSLLEVLVVVVILSVLAATLIPRFGSSIEKSKISRAETELKTFKTALTKVFFDTNYFPKDVSANQDPGLTLKTRVPRAHQKNWDGPYLERWPKNGHPWGGSYDYEYGRNTAMNFDGTAGNEVTLVMRDGALTQKILDRIDADLDDGNASTGLVRHNRRNRLEYFVGEGPKW